MRQSADGPLWRWKAGNSKLAQLLQLQKIERRSFVESRKHQRLARC